jgi:transposase-like protein
MPKNTVLNAPQFTNEDAAIAHLQASRWPDGVTCPHCGSDAVTRMGGQTQSGMFLCNDCRDKFTARTGTVMERSHIPVHKWLLAIHLLNSGKNGVSTHELHRLLGVTYKSAWFLSHRIREAMKEDNPTPMGGEGQSVQADETYYGNTSKRAKGYRKGHSHKATVVALVEPQGHARAFHIPRIGNKKIPMRKIVRDLLVTNVHRTSELHTDESPIYPETGKEFAAHKTVEHGSDRGRGFYLGKDGQTTNAVENFFGNFKRSMKGTYRFCGEQHLQRYLNEFQFRHNHRAKLGFTDGERAAVALKGIEGKRLTYRSPN